MIVDDVKRIENSLTRLMVRRFRVHPIVEFTSAESAFRRLLQKLLGGGVAEDALQRTCVLEERGCDISKSALIPLMIVQPLGPAVALRRGAVEGLDLFRDAFNAEGNASDCHVTHEEPRHGELAATFDDFRGGGVEGGPANGVES